MDSNQWQIRLYVTAGTLGRKSVAKALVMSDFAKYKLTTLKQVSKVPKGTLNKADAHVRVYIPSRTHTQTHCCRYYVQASFVLLRQLNYLVGLDLYYCCQ